MIPAVFGVILAGAGLLVAAELTPLLHVWAGQHHRVIASETAGSHDGYALLPVAALAAALGFAAWRSGSRAALVGCAAMGAVALGIALLIDLPDARATGLVRVGGTLVLGGGHPATGLYLETLGAVLILLGSVAGLLLARR